MSKLNGVKTLDMVNGEITKVSYEGAEYAKVDDLVKSTEDILLAIENGLDRTKGEFYRVISVGSKVRWEDNTSTNGVGAEYISDSFEVFRKISAQSKPTLEQRVETLESDVAAMKGEKVAEETIEFEGATYRKVDREAREGDVVTYASPSNSYVTKGKPYKVLSTDHGLRILDEDGDKLGVYNEWSRTHETVDVYEPIEQAKYVPQEGDIVVITGNTNMSRNKVGDIGKVSDVSHVNFAVDVPQKPKAPNVNGNKHEAYEVRKATPAEVEKYEQAVKNAEIAEKWAKIGRKPNEFKKGDVVHAKRPNYEGIGAVEDIGSSGYGVRFSNGDYKGFFSDEEGSLELVAPVESLFNNA